MDWYPWYFTLYEQDTMHLNPYQDGCYRRLIDHYMKTRAPLPDNEAALARIVGDSEANWVAMASPCVRHFFTPKNGRLYLKRCEETLEYQDKKAKSLSESGKIGAKKRWSKINTIDSHPIATPMGSAIAQDSTLHYSNNTNVLLAKGSKSVPRPDDVSESIWSDHLKTRKAKRQPMTETALEGMRQQANIAGMSLEAALTEACQRGWGSFKAEWLINNQSKGTLNGKQKLAADTAKLLERIGAEGDR